MHLSLYAYTVCIKNQLTEVPVATGTVYIVEGSLMVLIKLPLVT